MNHQDIFSPWHLNYLIIIIITIIIIEIKRTFLSSAGFPKQTAAELILRTMGRYLRERPKSSLKQVYFVLFDEESVKVYISELERMQE